MSEGNFNEDNVHVSVCNYCCAFVDLMGQKNALSLYDEHPSYADYNSEKFDDSFYKTIGQIVNLQKESERLLAKSSYKKFQEIVLKHDGDFSVRHNIGIGKIKIQRWSDGIVLFAPLAEEINKCPVISVVEILFNSALNCLNAIRDERVVRGGVDLYWGCELRKGELYGGAVARAYECEKKAVYPRIVVGEYVVDYFRLVIESYSHNSSNEVVEYSDFQCAKFMMGILKNDPICAEGDDIYIVDYLSNEFLSLFFENYEIDKIFQDAFVFMDKNISLFSGDEKILSKYKYLKKYFSHHDSLRVHR